MTFLLPIAMFANQSINVAPTSLFWIIFPAYIFFVLLGVIAGALLLFKFVRGDINLKNPNEWLDRIPWTFKNALPVFAIVIIIQIVFIILIRLLRMYNFISASRETIALLTSIHGVVFHIFAVLIIYFFCRARFWQIGKTFGISSQNIIMNFGRALLVYAISLPCVIGLAIINNFIMFLQGKEVGLQEVIFVFSTPASFWNLIFLVLLAVVFAPIAEEMLFRGILLPILAKKVGIIPSVLITSFLFAAIHMHLPSILPFFVLAMALAISYIYWGTLLVPILIHSIFNLMSTALVLSSNLLPK